jgi:predicted nucleotidyltransferase
MNDTYINQINSIFCTILKGREVRILLFGSQSRNDASSSSDYDFAVDCGRKIERSILVSLKEMFEDSTFPYRVDIVDFNNVSKTMKDQIIKYGKEWKYLS